MQPGDAIAVRAVHGVEVPSKKDLSVRLDGDAIHLIVGARVE